MSEIRRVLKGTRDILPVGLNKFVREAVPDDGFVVSTYKVSVYIRDSELEAAKKDEDGTGIVFGKGIGE